jgi:hypothetical protein
MTMEAHSTPPDDFVAARYLMAGFIALGTLIIAMRVLLLALTTSL